VKVNGSVNGFVLSSRFFALRAVVGSSGPEVGVQSSSVSVAFWPLPASGPEDYSPKGDLVNRATLTNLVSTNVTVYFRDSAATNFNQRFYRAVVRRV
jgi:hypothetical protein